MKRAAGVLALAAFAWAAWPDLDAFSTLPPEDIEALGLVRDLERGREGAWDAAVRSRRPRVVPALAVLTSTEGLNSLLHGEESSSVACCSFLGRPHDPADAFESALQAAVLEGYRHDSLKQRGCVRSGSSAQYELERRLEDPEPGVRFAAAFRLWNSGSERTVPRVLGMLGEHAFARYPWLEPVAEVKRRETSCAAICGGAGRGERRALAAAAFLRHRPAVEGILRLLNDPSTAKLHADLAWTLGEIGDPAAIPALEKLLDAGAYWDRGDAAEALGKIGSTSSLSAIVRLAETGRGYDQALALRALGRLGSEAELPVLERFAASTEYTGAIGRRSLAASALAELRRRAHRP